MNPHVGERAGHCRLRARGATAGCLFWVAWVVILCGSGCAWWSRPDSAKGPVVTSSGLPASPARPRACHRHTTLRTPRGPFGDRPYVCLHVSKAVCCWFGLVRTITMCRTPWFVSLSEAAAFCSAVNHRNPSALTQPRFVISHGSGLVRARLRVPGQLRVTSRTLPLGSLLVPGQAERVLVAAAEEPAGSRSG